MVSESKYISVVSEIDQHYDAMTPGVTVMCRLSGSEVRKEGILKRADNDICDGEAYLKKKK